MKKYSDETIARIRQLRASGLTYAEINAELQTAIPKPSFAYICRNIVLPTEHHERMRKEGAERLTQSRVLALKRNKEILAEKRATLRNRSMYAATLIKDQQVAKVALAMLYLGEGSKWESTRGLRLGSTSAQIIMMYIHLLESCFGIERSKMHAQIQHRADQNGDELTDYWCRLTDIPRTHFYPPTLISAPSEK